MNISAAFHLESKHFVDDALSCFVGKMYTLEGEEKFLFHSKVASFVATR